MGVNSEIANTADRTSVSIWKTVGICKLPVMILPNARRPVRPEKTAGRSGRYKTFPQVPQALRLSEVGRNAKLRAEPVRVRTVLSENGRLALLFSRLIV